MTTQVVVDSSVAVGWVRKSQETPASARLLAALIDGQVVSVPSLWPLEMSNILLMLQRRGRLADEDRVSALERLKALPIAVDHEAAGIAWSRLSSMAAAHRLTIYDAAYLELASRRRGLLATRDEALITAARASGVQLWE